VSQNPDFVYEKTKQASEGSGIELLNIQETLKKQVFGDFTKNLMSE
jgi:hypothetical protein